MILLLCGVLVNDRVVDLKIPNDGDGDVDDDDDDYYYCYYGGDGEK